MMGLYDVDVDVVEEESWRGSDGRGKEEGGEVVEEGKGVKGRTEL